MVTLIYGYREFFEGTVVPSKISVRGTIILVHGKCSTISLNMNSTVWLLYYCLIKYCLKHCVCFYQVAILQEILKIVSMFVVHVSSFILT